jgi:hypothetical protein
MGRANEHSVISFKTYCLPATAAMDPPKKVGLTMQLLQYIVIKTGTRKSRMICTQRELLLRTHEKYLQSNNKVS